MHPLKNSITVDRPVFPDNTFRITDFGAVNDGKTDNTNAFRSAIEACSKTGGRILLSGGKWLTGAIHFKSNVNVHLDDDAVIIFSDTFADYLPPVFSRWEGVECYNYSPMIYANNCENIALTGKGTIEGSGEAWWPWKKLQHDAVRRLYHAEYNKIPVNERVFGSENDALRPYFVQLINCRNILFDGPTFINGPMWTISPVYCDNALFTDIKIRTNGPNTDGINPESSKNIIIENCLFETGDDCIAINSGMNEDGWRVCRQCENIVIRNCTMRGGHACVAIGSGVSGGIKNVFVHDCDFTGGGERGIRIKTMPGRGGFVKDIYFENIEISDKKYNAIQMTGFFPSSSAPSVSEAPTLIENIHFSDIKGINNKNAIDIDGTPENHFRNLHFENISLEAETGLTLRNTDNLAFSNVTISAKEKF
jgi:polygalacturonase